MTTHRFRALDDQRLDDFYGDIAGADLQPLWELSDLLTAEPQPHAVPYLWAGKLLRSLVERSGDLVDLSRGGDRRVLALSNPGLRGQPFATPTLWAAVQYLLPGEVAPAHRHTAAALRLVLEGEGVWTLVDGDPVSMAPGDVVLTPNWTWHEHHNSGTGPMVWFDALDLPLVQSLDAIFFEQGSGVPPSGTAASSYSELTFGAAAGLLPADLDEGKCHSPLLVYRWEQTDRALDALIRRNLARGGDAHAHVRFTNPTTGGDVMPTLRCEMHRLEPAQQIPVRRCSGSSVAVVMQGAGLVRLGDDSLEVSTGDIFAVPSWCPNGLEASSQLDMFVVSDAPVMEALGLERYAPVGETGFVAKRRPS